MEWEKIILWTFLFVMSVQITVLAFRVKALEQPHQHFTPEYAPGQTRHTHPSV